MVRFGLAVLALWRVTHLFIWEDGPFNLFGAVRNWAGVEYDPVTSEPYGDTFLSTLLSCIFCLSVWVSTLFALIDYLTNRKQRAKGLTYNILTPLAISAGVIIVNKFVRTSR